MTNAPGRPRSGRPVRRAWNDEVMSRLPPSVLLLGGCVVLGAGVGMLLVGDVGSDGFSTLVNGLARASGMPFWAANLLVACGFLGVASARRVRPGWGSVTQIVLVGFVVTVVLSGLPRPEGWAGRIAMVVAAFPVLAAGIAAYLGSHSGAGPAEAAALAWDPPIPFRWSYNLVQGVSALVGWLLGATVGPGTIAVVVLLGPLIDLASRLLRLEVHQGAVAPSPSDRRPS